MMNEYKGEKQFEKFSNEELFCLYNNTKRLDAKQEIALRYLYVVKSIALQMKNVYIGFEQTNDIINEGVIVLMNCIDKYQSDKNASFETYISNRLRGMVIDIARKQDWIPRTTRKIYNNILQFSNEYYMNYGKEPTADEVCEKLGIEKEKYNEIMSKSSLFSIISLDMAIEQRQDSQSPLQIQSDIPQGMPEENLEQKHTKEILEKAILQLNEKEQIVTSLYYKEQVNMKDIAKILQVSEARVSQIHSNALKKMKDSILKNT